MADDPESHYQMKLERKLQELGVWYRFLEKPQSTVHTADASAVTGIELHKISKNLMAKTKDGRYAALIIPGDRVVDYKKAAQELDAKGLSLVPFEEADKISGYPPGGTPSLGYEKNLQVLLDEELTAYETFYCGGGSTRMLLEVRRDDVVRVNGAKVCRISKPK